MFYILLKLLEYKLGVNFFTLFLYTQYKNKYIHKSVHKSKTIYEKSPRNYIDTIIEGFFFCEQQHFNQTVSSLFSLIEMINIRFMWFVIC